MQKIDTKSSKGRLIYATKLKFDFACGLTQHDIFDVTLYKNIAESIKTID